MKRLVTVEEVREALTPLRRQGRKIGLVPTMGGLHEGHLSLVGESRKRCDVTLVSVFVNPTQFGAGEDFETYPRDLEADATLLAKEGVDFLFAPSVEVMYPPGSQTRIDPGPLAIVWCGASRPGHFAGVATVVVKLLEITQPDEAFFGEKDYQQFKVIERVVRDLDIPVRVTGCPIVREPGGLAMSTRNNYLTPGQREHARVLFQALEGAQKAAASGETDASAITEGICRTIAQADDVDLEYAAVMDCETLQPVAVVDRPSRALVAARVGKARLIDNVSIPAPARAGGVAATGAGRYGRDGRR